LQMFSAFGVPDTIQGVIRQADLRGDGSIKQPNVQGIATLQNLSVNGEVFPEARVTLASTAAKLNLDFEAGQNLSLKAQIDTATPGYPFTGQASFTQFSLANVAKLTEGSIIATGNANLSGVLNDSTRLRGEGRIESVVVRVRDTTLQPTQPFTFS